MVEAISYSLIKYPSHNSSVLKTIIGSSEVLSVQAPSIDNERAEILAWLSPLEPRTRHQDVRNRREENIGDWLIQSEEFKSWYEGSGANGSHNAALFCYGDPGAGKTYISSLVIDTICDQVGGHGVSVACFYFDFAARNEQTATNMLGAVLKQVVSGLKQIPDEIAQAFGKQKTVIGGRGLRLPEIAKMLEDIATSQRMFLCVDALDECVEGHRFKILGSLNGILKKSPGTRVFMTGRPHVRADVERRLPGTTESMSISPSRGDIVTFLRTRLDEDPNPDAMDDALEADILEKIPEKISEIFLLVSLNIEAILQETTIHRRRNRLSAMLDGINLGDAYGVTIERITAQGGEKARLGMAALMWISLSQRPLHADELCHALAVEIGATHLNPDNIPSILTLLRFCQGLIIVEKDTSTVRLIHFTLQEYLSTRLDLFGTAHSIMAETCLTYLNSQQILDISPSDYRNLQSTPFLEYSSIRWGAHAKLGYSSSTKSLALQFFGRYKNHVSAKILTRHVSNRPYPLNWVYPSDHSLLPLHCASIFGLVELAETLLEMGSCDINGRDSLGATPLIWAAIVGNEDFGVAKLLLARGDVNPDYPDYCGATPLSWAASNGHEGVVKLLLSREDVNPDYPDQDGQTPLSWAAYNGHEGVAELLLSREDVNPDYPDQDGRTPLSWAAHRNHEGVIKLLQTQTAARASCAMN
ncbi:hypothetical protein L873DRAFT_1762725 [Choiromyces venosus 120613-1]|uniref:Uncharacterized protein n=1 Tax=Choiromyces venosus 120613-1 TaxID=1336337 RepID=A0A3N4JXT1_9PEZI|nr:hypothetical protein L873DRAFT_1762725 [Choiromyces venosus 120613-1]